MGEILLEFISGIFEGILESVLDTLPEWRRKRLENASNRGGIM